MDEKEIKRLIRNGKTTAGEIEDGTDFSRSYVNRLLKQLTNDDVLVRNKNGRTWVYQIKEQIDRDSNAGWSGENMDSGTAVAEASTANIGMQANLANQNTPLTPDPSVSSGNINMPVDRDYSFSKEIPQNIPPYIPSGEEVAQMLGSINTRQESGKLPRYLVGGPTGCGKTHLAKYIAQHLEMPLFSIQGKWALNEADLLGGPVMVGDTSWWVDGELTKAILASRERPVMLLVDEVNRARPDSKGVLYPALDSRCEVRLDMRGGEKIQGNPMNLIVIGTINEGRGYYNEEMDLAEIRRLSTKHNVDYLGREHPDREVSLICDRTPAGKQVSEQLVETANLIRDLASKQNNITIGIPTANVISWAQEAYAYNEQNMSNPIFKAAQSTVLRPYYDSSPDAKGKVEEVIQQKFDGAPFEEDEFAKWSGKDLYEEMEETQNR